MYTYIVLKTKAVPQGRKANKMTLRIVEEMTWKTHKLGYLKGVYGGYVAEFDKYHDDRKLYCNMYRSLVEAVESLPDEPNGAVKVAMNRYINGELDTMQEIIDYFKNK